MCVKKLKEPVRFKETILVATAISIIAVFVSYFIPGELTTLEVFTPKEKANDFSFSDFYTMTANSAQTIETDPDITIIALDGCSRAQMGQAIAKADSGGAAVIGLDLIFSPPTSGQDSVIAAIDTARNIVLPVILTGDDENHFSGISSSYFMPLLAGSHDIGSVNINGSLENTTTRLFKAEFEIDQEYVPSISTVIADIYRPGAAVRLLERGSETELINFSNKAFNILTPDMMDENMELLDGHIVLMGYLNDPADMHRSPLVNRMPGILIHACTIATIINDEYVSYSPEWLSILVAIISCILIVGAGIHFRLKAWGAILVRAIQILLMVGALYIGSFVFIRYNYSFDFMPTITVSILGLVIMDITIGMTFFINRSCLLVRRLIGKIVYGTGHRSGNNSKKNQSKHIAC